MARPYLWRRRRFVRSFVLWSGMMALFDAPGLEHLVEPEQETLHALIAREAIRDLVARYNANADTARFAQVLELFSPDAEMTIPDGTYRGHDEILSIFTGTRDGLAGDADDNNDAAGGAGAPNRPRATYVRHATSTHQIDLIDADHANGRCYYQVTTAVGLDHWGRYIDTYRRADGRWMFASRRVTVDDYAPNSLFR